MYRAGLRGVLWLIYSEELKGESKLGTLSILISEEYPLQQYFLFFFFPFYGSSSSFLFFSQGCGVEWPQIYINFNILVY